MTYVALSKRVASMARYLVGGTTAVVVCLGCSSGQETVAPDVGAMNDRQHGHYHVHTVDVSHEHDHVDGERGGHSHRHAHPDDGD